MSIGRNGKLHDTIAKTMDDLKGLSPKTACTDVPVPVFWFSRAFRLNLSDLCIPR